jgi:hypothetical protein
MDRRCKRCLAAATEWASAIANLARSPHGITWRMQFSSGSVSLLNIFEIFGMGNIVLGNEFLHKSPTLRTVDPDQ